MWYHLNHGASVALLALVLAPLACNGIDENPHGNRSPSVSAPLPTAFVVGQATTVFFSVTDPDGDPYAVTSFEARTTTDYMPYDISDRASVAQVPGGAELTWTPIPKDVGKFTLCVHVKDDHGHTGADCFTAQVFASPP